MESSERYRHPDQELGLLDEETGQQWPQDITVPDDVGGAICDGESEDENAPLLGKTAKKKSRDKKSRRETDNEIKGDKERERINKARGDKGGKKEKGESTSKGQGERIPTDTDKSAKRDTAVAERKKAAPRDKEEIVREKEKGEAKEAGAKVKGGKVKHADKVKDREKTKEKIQGGQSEADPLLVRDTNETIKEMKRGGPRDGGHIETKDKDERVKERGKGGTEKEKIKNTRLTEAERMDRDETVKERKRGGPRDAAKGEAKDEGTTKRKKEDKNTPEIKERGAEAKDEEDKTKEKKRRDKEKKRRSREKD